MWNRAGLEYRPLLAWSHGRREGGGVFRWTQYADHPADPGPSLLGDPATALEIGSGTGRSAAYLCGNGVKVTGVDLSPVAVEETNRRYGHLGAEFVCAEVLAHLAGGKTTYDAVYSIFGAAWFTDPARLFPLVLASLNPGGRFLFSQPPAIPGAYGPQGMYKGGFAGPATFTYRYSYRPKEWEEFLTAAGFTEVEAREIDAPTPGHIGTLIVSAVRP
ncbi:class I SAM-dependent methyltransferase [Streptomyces sp. H27-S2]|uniref:class I SAM-dependent methyltransferase n=1 Tax=Streptomyces antarcticus TaxID=2996458 RepID=UPI0022719A6E|nr:class I SAM-dependent methyltransferase [Streptomyces sp. H27-S2]MCY0949037.1 methyltransferase domain-containing protein [Streptomyces sp. H27-S2]